MKKMFSVLAIALMSVCFVACGHKAESNAEETATVDTVLVDTVVKAEVDTVLVDTVVKAEVDTVLVDTVVAE